MTIKEQLIREIEAAPDQVIEEVFDFLLLAKIKHHRLQEQSKPFALQPREDCSYENFINYLGLLYIVGRRN
jgi:hypothetical protein